MINTVPQYLIALAEIANTASRKILEIYHLPLEAQMHERKADNSPLTLADREANSIIVNGLMAITPHIPIVSEEGADIPFEVRKTYSQFYCVDPLDGTKEFVNRNGQFTVNIGLIRNGNPVAGVIVVPVTGEVFVGEVGTGAYYAAVVGMDFKPITTNKSPDVRVAVVSRSHGSDREAHILAKHGATVTQQVGSSLKFCKVAKGDAYIFARPSTTMEWDTAAGHAIAQAAGATITDLNGLPLVYNKPDLRNNGFICVA